MRGARTGIRSINAVTLTTTDMPRSVAFYAALGFRTSYGGANSRFTVLDIGVEEHLNLALPEMVASGSGDQGLSQPTSGFAGWGRVIFHLADGPAVDALYRQATDAGLAPQEIPRDAEWGERYFQLRDPDGHELSFAARLDAASPDGEAAGP